MAEGAFEPEVAALLESIDGVPAPQATPRLAGTPQVDPASDERPRALVETSSDGAWARSPAGYTVLRRLRREEVVLEVNAFAPAYLFVADPYYPGWRAFVDGEAAPIYRANYLFRAVPVQPGIHEVVIRFQPWSVALGGLISLTTGGLVLVMSAGSIGAALWRRWHTRTHAGQLE